MRTARRAYLKPKRVYISGSFGEDDDKLGDFAKKLLETGTEAIYAEGEAVHILKKSNISVTEVSSIRNISQDIDLVVCPLKNKNREILRSAAKKYERCVPIFDTADFDAVSKQLSSKGINTQTRRKLAKKVFANTGIAMLHTKRRHFRH